MNTKLFLILLSIAILSCSAPQKIKSKAELDVVQLDFIAEIENETQRIDSIYKELETAINSKKNINLLLQKLHCSGLMFRLKLRGIEIYCKDHKKESEYLNSIKGNTNFKISHSLQNKYSYKSIPEIDIPKLTYDDKKVIERSNRFDIMVPSISEVRFDFPKTNEYEMKDVFITGKVMGNKNINYSITVKHNFCKQRTPLEYYYPSLLARLKGIHETFEIINIGKFNIKSGQEAFSITYLAKYSGIPEPLRINMVFIVNNFDGYTLQNTANLENGLPLELGIIKSMSIMNHK
jgi:hypothetical protein